MSIRNLNILLFAVSPLFACATAVAQTNWIDGGVDGSWSNTANWSSGVPGSGTAVAVTVQPSQGFIGLDTGNTTNAISSLTFSSGLSSFSIVSLGAETLSISGAIINNSGQVISFELPLLATGSAIWSGSMSYAPVSMASNTITLSGNHAFTGALNFDISGANTYGHLAGAFTATFSTVQISLNGYAPVEGDSFDFTTGGFGAASYGTLPTLSNGLVWNTSNFLTQGILSVSAVPEPATYAVLLGLTVLGFGAVRRRRRA